MSKIVMIIISAFSYIYIWTLCFDLLCGLFIKFDVRKYDLYILQDTGFVSSENVQKLRELIEAKITIKNTLQKFSVLSKKEVESNESVVIRIEKLHEELRIIDAVTFAELQKDNQSDLPILDFSDVILV